jgi:hypothetical protein
MSRYEKKHRGRAWWSERSPGEKAGLIVLGLVAGAGLVSLFGLLVMSIWNWVMPSVFGLSTITYWQTWGLLFLSCVLLGGLGRGSRDTDSRHGDRSCREERTDTQEPNDGLAAGPTA